MKKKPSKSRSIKPTILKNISNPTSVHGIYPYRGKISPKDVISVLSKLSSNKLLLDPFCGTGTILYEAIRVGNNVIGVDPNPLANIITRGKMDLKKLDREKTMKEVESIIKKAILLKNPNKIPTDMQKGYHR